MNDEHVKTDPLMDDDEVQISQLLQKVFLMGLLVGKQQLQDDMAASGSPLGQLLGQLQQSFEMLMPGTTQAAEMQVFTKNLFKYKELENFAKKEKEEKVKIQNENLTPNHQRINAQHDQITRQLMDSLEEEFKQTASDIVKETKMLKSEE